MDENIIIFQDTNFHFKISQSHKSAIKTTGGKLAKIATVTSIQTFLVGFCICDAVTAGDAKICWRQL